MPHIPSLISIGRCRANHELGEGASPYAASFNPIIKARLKRFSALSLLLGRDWFMRGINSSE